MSQFEVKEFAIRTMQAMIDDIQAEHVVIRSIDVKSRDSTSLSSLNITYSHTPPSPEPQS